MSSYPVQLHNDPSTGLTAEQLAVAQSNEANMILEVHRHLLWSRALAEMERLDAEAAADARRASLVEEVEMLHDGLALAGRSVAAVELVARSVESLARVDERRFLRRFGG